MLQTNTVAELYKWKTTAKITYTLFCGHDGRTHSKACSTSAHLQCIYSTLGLTAVHCVGHKCLNTATYF